VRAETAEVRSPADPPGRRRRRRRAPRASSSDHSQSSLLHSQRPCERRNRTTPRGPKLQPREVYSTGRRQVRHEVIAHFAQVRVPELPSVTPESFAVAAHAFVSRPSAAEERRRASRS